MFPIFTSLKVKAKKVIRNEMGIILIELLIVLALLGLIGGGVKAMFFTSIRSYDAANEQIDSYSSGRWTFMLIERQIKSSDKIYLKNNIVYIQDKETPKYYNYYTLENKKIMKHKVYEENLRTIGSGSTSQLADNIKEFELNHIEENVFYIKIISQVKDKVLELSSRIRVGSNIIER